MKGIFFDKYFGNLNKFWVRLHDMTTSFAGPHLFGTIKFFEAR